MAFAFYASPVDFKNNPELETKLNVEKSKINKNMIADMKTSLQTAPTNIADIHKNLKEENDNTLTDFYNKELPVAPKQPLKTNDYLIMENTNMALNKSSNSEMLNKLNSVIELFENQKEIKTGQKNEEIILYCFLGVFVIYIMDSFVSIGKYSR